MRSAACGSAACRRWCWRSSATLGIVLTLAGVIGLQLAGLVSDLPRYEATVRSKVAGLRDGGFGRIPDLLKNVGRQIEEATKETPGTSAPPSQPEPRPMPVEVHQPDPSPLDLVRTVLGPLLHPLATVGIVFVALIFILLQREDLRDRMIRLFGASDLHRTTVAMDDAARRRRATSSSSSASMRPSGSSSRSGCGRSAFRARSCGASSRR